MEKLENTQTKDQIAIMLREGILSGRLKDGEELTQKQLAEKFEVSRTPVREALQILELEGLLLRLPNRHVRVVGLQERTIRENMRIVAAVESEIALIIMGYSPDTLSPLEPDHDRRFHTGISELTHNHYIQRMHTQLLEGYPKYIWNSMPGRANPALNKAILAAVKSGDESAVRESIHFYYDFLAGLLLDPV